jgi:hypothetical protein
MGTGQLTPFGCYSLISQARIALKKYPIRVIIPKIAGPSCLQDLSRRCRQHSANDGRRVTIRFDARAPTADADREAPIEGTDRRCIPQTIAGREHDLERRGVRLDGRWMPNR